MEGSFEIIQFLPKVGIPPLVGDYIEYHVKELDKSIENNIEMGIYVHTHILYMVFIYFQLLRISQVKEEEFRYSWIGLANHEKNFHKDNLNPFSFSSINEKTVFRFFRLIHFDDGTIGNISDCVNCRNDILHASGNHIQELEKKIQQYLNNMENIVKKSESFLKEIFQKFKDDNPTLFEPGYEITIQDIEAQFYIPYYISDYEVQKLIDWMKSGEIIEIMKAEIE